MAVAVTHGRDADGSSAKTRAGGSMEAEIDLGLDSSQWETLKVLGAPNPDYRRMNQLAFQQLVTRQLAAMVDGHPIITPMGRKVVVRGSPQLWGRSA
jgi:hypothetical protein